MFKKYRPYLFSLIFIQNLITSGISNYSTNSLYIKIISGLLTFIFIFINYRIDFNNLLIELKKNKIFFISLIFFISYLTGSLIWSTNQKFGTLKLIHFLVGNTPLFVSLFLVLLNDEIKKGLIKSIIFVGVTTGIISLVLNPFNPYLPYSFQLIRWSHVVFGRFSGLSFLIAILILEKQREKKKIIVFTIISIIIFISLISSGYRSGIIGAILSLICYYFIVSLKGKDFRKNLRIIFITGAIIITSISIALLSNYNYNSTRFEGIAELILAGNTEDGTINSRLEAYKTGLRMFAENPLFGQGLGGFNNKFMGSDIGIVLKYPHNIIIEFLSELGLAGFGFLIAFMLVVLRKLIAGKEELLVLFIYGIIIAMFGKDIGSNVLVWLFASVNFLGGIRVEGYRL